MKRIMLTIAATILLTTAGSTLADGHRSARSRAESACTPPNELSSSIEETACRIWVAATCPVNQTQYPFVVWENWIEQAQMYPLDPANGLKVPNSQAQTIGVTRVLHASPPSGTGFEPRPECFNERLRTPKTLRTG